MKNSSGWSSSTYLNFNSGNCYMHNIFVKQLPCQLVHTHPQPITWPSLWCLYDEVEHVGWWYGMIKLFLLQLGSKEWYDLQQYMSPSPYYPAALTVSMLWRISMRDGCVLNGSNSSRWYSKEYTRCGLLWRLCVKQQFTTSSIILNTSSTISRSVAWWVGLVNANGRG